MFISYLHCFLGFFFQIQQYKSSGTFRGPAQCCFVRGHQKLLSQLELKWLLNRESQSLLQHAQPNPSVIAKTALGPVIMGARHLQSLVDLSVHTTVAAITDSGSTLDVRKGRETVDFVYVHEGEAGYRVHEKLKDVFKYTRKSKYRRAFKGN